MTEVEQEEKPKDELEEQDRRATGYGGRNPEVFEIMIVKNLYTAISAFPLRKIELIIDAAWQIPHEVLAKTLGAEKMDRLRMIGSLNRSLSCAKEYELGEKKIASVSWRISDSDYEKWCRAWLEDIEITWIVNYNSPYQEELFDEIRKWEKAGMPEHEVNKKMFFLCSHYLAPYCLQDIQQAYLDWASEFIIGEVASTVGSLLSPGARRSFEKLLSQPDPK